VKGALLSLPVLVGVIVLGGCGQTQSTRPQPTSPPTATAPDLPGGFGLSPSDPNLTDQIVLKSVRSVLGHPIDGALVVVNHGTTPINLTKGCKPDFVIALTNGTYKPMVAFPLICSTQPFIIQPGTNRLPFQVVTTYLGCGNGAGPSAVPACIHNMPRPLPTGTYDAVLIGDGSLPLPEPRPVAITLTT
jgi:hypothetical protein